MIAESVHIGFAVCGLALRIRGPHICWVHAKNIGNGALVLSHLLHAHVRGDFVETVVGPGVRGDLVAFIDHSTDQVRVRVGSVDGAFVVVVSRDEKGGVKAKFLEDIKELARILVGSIVVSQRHYVVLGAAMDIVVVSDLTQSRSQASQG